ncbi:MAG: hypothetical protein KF684_03090 [Phycisphaeraceae bacterium]|nr:hypothetical protein [Phycisphaeraceae bacterium]
MKKILAAAAFASLAFPASVAIASPEEDVNFRVANGRIITGLLDEGAFVRERVFGVELGEALPNFADEPGFFSDEGVFTPDSFLTLRVLDGLRVWNGSDFDNLADSTMTLQYLQQQFTTAGLGFAFDTFDLPVNSFGSLDDEHPDYILNSPATDGVYLLALSIRGGGASESLPFYLVFNQNFDDKIHDAAIDFVRDVIVPAPGAVATLGLAGLLGARRRRA